MNKVKVGVNGFGRIGRQVLKAIYERHHDEVEIVAVNDLFDIDTNAHLLSYDTNYGRFPVDVHTEGTVMHIGDWKVQNFKERDPRNIPWGSLGVDVVVESTGIFRKGPQANMHREAGAKKVIITAPANDEDLTVVLGVNDQMYDPAKHNIISNASCTTNCLAPVALVLHKNFGIKSGTMCTVHSYTNDQRILDLPHSDLRRARAAACNIIPTSTGAAKAVALVIPELKGRFSGYSLRVPTPTVSIVDFAAILEKPTDTETMKKVLKEASEGPLKGILGYSTLPMVSSDFKGDFHSSIVEDEFCKVQDGVLAKVVAWYDNEWGYSCRVSDLIKLMADKGL
ncbi:type I glyceraldehyde-3-phosphate dehydrogenase [Fundidesulfovibrio butyratiphilus]